MVNSITSAQQIAANPEMNVWVAASAGTGKTKVLTDRLLNLMIHGNIPERILCLTFTQAAAAEMQTRLMHRLARWTTLHQDTLRQDLHALLGYAPTEHHLSTARQLFLKVLDTPQGIKIQTIHGFCQSLLTRFPLEAQLPPQVTILDDFEANRLLLQARGDILLQKEDPEFQALLITISQSMKEFSFQEFLEALLSQRARIRELLTHWSTMEKAEEELKKALNIPDDIALQAPDLIENHIQKWCALNPFASELSVINTQKPSPLLTQWLDNPDQRSLLFKDYCRLFLTIDGRISLRPKVKCPAEAERVYQFSTFLNSLSLGQKTLSLYGLCSRIFHRYQDLKLSQGKLDYDDLIEQTILLLNQPGISSWILYKLDGGIDHILVDEAQDTNPAQWHIIRLMTEEFFTSDRLDRTLFVVGDAKQAIYSFQGANPKDFMNFRSFFADRLQKSQFPWRDIELDISFRSAPTILNLVDRIFADPTYQQALLASLQNIRHRPHRLEAQGSINLWPPVLEDQSSIQLEPWPLPPRHFDMGTSVQKLADYVADQIAEMVQKGLYLPATGTSAQPKDILILLRKRSAIVLELIRALKMRQIPVAGSDRLVLHDHIVVEDLLSLAKFALLPDDDLSLAEVLKSPFIGISEDELFELAHNREGNLWQEVKKNTLSPAYLFLADMLGKVDYLPPYQWFQRALIHHHGRDKILTRLGIEAEDILYEFIYGVLNYQLTTQGTLQQFVDYFLANPIEIKRNSSDQYHNQVRIMTVHGAKGLQAPIVILLDQLDGREPIDRLLWQTDVKGHINFMLLRPSQANDVPLSTHLKQETATAHDAEDKRLLYVALTRAQDHLFIGGWGKKINDDCWYAIIQRHYHEIPQLSPKFQKSMSTSQNFAFSFPEWIHLPPQTWLTGLTPQSSAAKIELTPAISRGIILHKLLEVLADCPHDQRLLVAQKTLTSFKEKMSDWGNDLSRLLDFLDHPDWHSFFGHNSQAEVDIHGIVDGHRFHGRIDRLVELDEEVWILDYKSSHQDLATSHIIPSIYRRQLHSYKSCLIPLYPDKTIRCFILWLETLTLVEVE